MSATQTEANQANIEAGQANLEALGSEKLSRLILRLSIPAVLAMTVNLLYNLVDRLFMGHYSAEALGAITAVMPYMTILTGFSLLAGSGAAALISIQLGQNDKVGAQRSLSVAFMLLLALSVLIMVPSFLMQNLILKMSGTTYTTQEMVGYASDYLFVIIIGVPFQLVGNGLVQTVRAEGSAKPAMYAVILGALINIVLDPVFIFLFNMGSRGAAIATIIGQAVTMLWVLGYYASPRRHLSLRFFKPKLKELQSVLAYGLPQFLIQVASAAIMLVYNHSLGRYGQLIDPERGADVAFAAFGIITSVSLVLIMPINGLSQGIQPILGYNYGARRYDRVRKTFLIAIVYATIWMGLGFLAAELLPHYIIKAFNGKDADLLQFGALALRITAVFLPLVGFQQVSSNYFLSAGRPKTSSLLSMSRQVFLFIPILLFLPMLLPTDLKIYGVIWASPIADLLSALIAVVFVLIELKRLNRLITEEQMTL